MNKHDFLQLLFALPPPPPIASTILLAMGGCPSPDADAVASCTLRLARSLLSYCFPMGLYGFPLVLRSFD